MAKFAFEKLEVWKLSVEFTLKIYQVTKKIPEEEKYGLTSQIRRASVSISSNLAEGSSRNTPKDQRRFYNIAYSSSIEVMNQIIIMNRLSFLSDTDYEEMRNELERITRMINALHNSTNQ